MDPITDAEGNSLGYTYEDLADMTPEQREAFYASLFIGLTEEEIAALEESLQAQYYSYYGDSEEGYYVQAAQLQAIIDSEVSSVTEKANAELLLAEMQGELDVYENFSTETSDAELYTAEHLRDATDGSPVTIDAGEDVANGEEYNITCASSSDTTTTDADWLDTNPELWDTDGDMIGDTAGDANGDGIADQDFNGDGQITEADLSPINNTEAEGQVVNITVESTDRVQFTYTEGDPNTCRMAITKEDGRTYYVTVTWPAGTPMPNFYFSNSTALHSADITGLDPTLLNHIFATDVSSEYSVGHYTGVADPEVVDEDVTYHTSVDMAEYSATAQETANTYTATVTDEDMAQNRSYEITLQDGVVDTLNFNFPPDAVISFSQGADGELIITATSEAGSVTITIHGWQTAYSGTGDVINLSGGTLAEDASATLMSLFPAGEGGSPNNTAASIINFDGQNVLDEWYASEEESTDFGASRPEESSSDSAGGGHSRPE